MDFGQSRDQLFHKRELQKEEEQKGSPRVQDQIVNVAGADHEQILEKFHGNDKQKGRGKENEPFFLALEQIGQEERHGHKGANISHQIQKGVVDVYVSAQKALDVNVVDAAEGNRVDKSLIVCGSFVSHQIIDRVLSSSHGGIQQGKRKDQIEIEEKEQPKEPRQQLFVSRSLGVEDAAQIKEQTGDHKKETAPQGMGMKL